MLLDGSEMDSFADLTHTPQGDVKNEAMFSLLPKFKNLTHTPQGDVKAFPLIKTTTRRLDLTHTPQGDTTEEPFLLCTNAAEKGSSAFLIFCAVFPTGHGGRAFLWV